MEKSASLKFPSQNVGVVLKRDSFLETYLSWYEAAVPDSSGLGRKGGWQEARTMTEDRERGPGMASQVWDLCKRTRAHTQKDPTSSWVLFCWSLEFLNTF